MKKQTYQKPDAEIIRFENEDIITTSINCKRPSTNGAQGCPQNQKHDSASQWGEPGLI